MPCDMCVVQLLLLTLQIELSTINIDYGKEKNPV